MAVISISNALREAADRIDRGDVTVSAMRVEPVWGGEHVVTVTMQGRWGDTVQTVSVRVAAIPAP